MVPGPSILNFASFKYGLNEPPPFTVHKSLPEPNVSKEKWFMAPDKWSISFDRLLANAFEDKIIAAAASPNNGAVCKSDLLTQCVLPALEADKMIVRCLPC